MVNLGGAAPLVAAAGAGTGSPSYRELAVFYYLGIPALAGLFVTVMSFAVSAVLVSRQDRKWQDPRWHEENQRFWTSLDRPILGSGAWTANDSWATNISTGFVVVGTFVAATASPSGMFPGIALDRFAFANLAAGFFVTAAPVLFGILYARFTAQNPGLTADSTVKLPGLRFATIGVPSGATVTIAADTAVHDDTPRWAVLRAGGAYQIPQNATIRVVAGVREAAQRCLTAAEGTIEAAAPHASAATRAAATEGLRLAIERALALAFAGPKVEDGGPAAGDIQDDVRREIGAPSVKAAAEESVIAANTPARAATPPGALARTVAIVNALRGRTVLAVSAPAAAQSPPPPAAIKRRVLARRVADIMAALDGAARQIGVEPAPARPGEADPAEADGHDTYPALAYAGAADIGVLPGSVVVLSGCAAQWTVAQADVLRPAPPADTLFQHPVLIHAAGGVKVTVTGAAGVTLGKDAVISAPRRAPYPLPKTRRLLAPQGTNLIVANLGIILAVNVLTMFGIGAQLGLAGVLAAFSVASPAGKGWLFAALGVVGLVAIWYAATATRALADPQPGSSISAQAGTSFTL